MAIEDEDRNHGGCEVGLPSIAKLSVLLDVDHHHVGLYPCRARRLDALAAVDILSLHWILPDPWHPLVGPVLGPSLLVIWRFPLFFVACDYLDRCDDRAGAYSDQAGVVECVSQDGQDEVSEAVQRAVRR